MATNRQRRKKGRPAVKTEDLRAIVSRLREWFTQREPALRPNGEPNLSEIQRRTGIPRTTISGWLGEGAPKGKKVADVPHLLGLARREHVSLNWLLLGIGPERLGAAASASTTAQELRHRVLAEVLGRLRVAPTLLEQIVPPADELLRSAVDAAASRVLDELAQRKQHLELSTIYAKLKQPLPPKRAEAQMRIDSVLEQLKRLAPITPEAEQIADETWRLQVEHEVQQATVDPSAAE